MLKDVFTAPDDPRIAAISQKWPVMFYPPKWGEYDRFLRFCGTTHKFDWQVRKRLPGLHRHLERALYLLEVAKRMEPNLAKDEAELEETGFSQTHNANALAAVVDAAFREMFSSLNCFMYVIRGIYPRGVKDSTTKLFTDGWAGKLPPTMPQEIRDAIKGTEVWFRELWKYRDEVTHADVGSSHRDKKTGLVFHMFAGLRGEEQGTVLIVKDVFSTIRKLVDEINVFFGAVFRVLNQNLEDKPTELECGVFHMLWYSRIVKPSEATDFHGGRCKAFQWFDNDAVHRCPFADVCGAYKRAKQESAQPG